MSWTPEYAPENRTHHRILRTQQSTYIAHTHITYVSILSSGGSLTHAPFYLALFLPPPRSTPHLPQTHLNRHSSDPWSRLFPERLPLWNSNIDRLGKKSFHIHIPILIFGATIPAKPMSRRCDSPLPIRTERLGLVWSYCTAGQKHPATASPCLVLVKNSPTTNSRRQ